MVTDGAWASSRTGIVLGIGAVAGIIAGGIGGGVVGRLGKKMMELAGKIQASGGPPTEAQNVEMEALQGRVQVHSALSPSCCSLPWPQWLPRDIYDL